MKNRPDDYLNNGEDMSPGGSQIFRHSGHENSDGSLPENSCVYINEICAHFDSLYPGRKVEVLHEIVSEFVHIDVHVMYPAPEDDFFVIYTTGMSDKPMNVPQELECRQDWQFAELFMCLPSSWNPAGKMTQENFWAVELLKFTARMPHMCSTWLADGHTMPNGPNYEPFLAGSQLSAMILIGANPPRGHFIADDGNRINLYSLIPLTRLEVEYKLEKGTASLLNKLDEDGVSFVVNAFRRSAV